MSGERGDEKGKRATAHHDSGRHGTSRPEAVESCRPFAATSKKQPEASAGAKNNTPLHTTCSRKFDMKHTTPTISESSFTLRSDGWFHVENEGVHPQREGRRRAGSGGVASRNSIGASPRDNLARARFSSTQPKARFRLWVVA